MAAPELHQTVLVKNKLFFPSYSKQALPDWSSLNHVPTAGLCWALHGQAQAMKHVSNSDHVRKYKREGLECSHSPRQTRQAPSKQFRLFQEYSSRQTDHHIVSPWYPISHRIPGLVNSCNTISCFPSADSFISVSIHTCALSLPTFHSQHHIFRTWWHMPEDPSLQEANRER